MYKPSESKSCENEEARKLMADFSMDSESGKDTRSRGRCDGRTVALVVITAYAFAISIFAFTWRREELSWSPARHVIRYERQRLDSGNSIYAHPRTEAVDQAWSDLLAPMNIRVTEREMKTGKENTNSAVRLADSEGGFIGGLAVYHRLHCLNLLRIALTPEFPMNKTGLEEELAGPHLEHCIERLRVGTMCEAQTALWSFKWQREPDGGLRQDVQSAAEMTCVSWEAIESWALARTAPQHRVLAEPTSV